MSDITFVHNDETFVRVECDNGIAKELNDHFVFEIPNARYHPKVKLKIWDGKIRLFDLKTRLIYSGLMDSIRQFAKKNLYSVEDYRTKDEISLEGLKDILGDCYVPQYTPRDYQWDAVHKAVRNKRALLLSPTSSGKSSIAYLIAAYYLKTMPKSRLLIIVPTIDLVGQLASDFAEYRGDKYDFSIHEITGGVDKDVNARVVITTWQSIYKLPKSWFDKFTVCIGDEAHLFKSDSMVGIMKKLNNCEYKYGMTGTLDGCETNKVVLEGLFGPVYTVITISELMERGYITKLVTNCIVLEYDEEERKAARDFDYQQEIEFLVSHDRRNDFLKKLALSRKGNTLLLFGRVEHGKHLHSIISEGLENRNVYLVYGGVDKADRKHIRKIVETENNAIIVASLKTFSTGISIRRLHSIITAHPSKSRITTLQSIGRVLRKGEGKDVAYLFDISDDLKWKSKINASLKHFLMFRLKYYREENFKHEIIKKQI